MISHSEKNGKLYFKYEDQLLAVVSKNVLSKFLEGKPNTHKEKRVLRNPISTKKQLESFIKYYFQQRDKFYRKKLPKI